ncbi:hypothetical protein [Phyllobacterium lublinensis]|jgi:hypothetical protein|uniref:hypothetical protein n=1 Tax=Phyllobacterium lublinensis TaxID=2875708 RepID=UPI001CCA1EDA|nr:hypothetical protein [Phyllobacterium sp. 2063]MBZ9657252.1 hypothetical protein [Phyllobacterium sp. 2063]
MASTKLEQLIGGLTLVAPIAATVTNFYPVSIYQPGIYEDAVVKFLLIIPVALGTLLTFTCMSSNSRLVKCFIAAVALAIIVAGIYFGFPADHWIHKWNWILSYCVWACFAPVLVKFVLSLV